MIGDPNTQAQWEHLFPAPIPCLKFCGFAEALGIWVSSTVQLSQSPNPPIPSTLKPTYVVGRQRKLGEPQGTVFSLDKRHEIFTKRWLPQHRNHTMQHLQSKGGGGRNARPHNHVAMQRVATQRALMQQEQAPKGVLKLRPRSRDYEPRTRRPIEGHRSALHVSTHRSAPCIMQRAQGDATIAMQRAATRGGSWGVENTARVTT